MITRRFRENLLYLRRVAYYALIRFRPDAHRLALISCSEYFDATYYLRDNLDVSDAGVDAAIHYLDFGAAEGRNPSLRFNTKYYSAQNPAALKKGENPLIHFLRHGRKAGWLAQKPYTFRRKHRSRELRLAPNAIVASRPPARPSVAPSQSSIAVYTAIVASYDKLRALRHRPSGCDFFVFSDEPVEVKGWTWLPLTYFDKDPTRMARFVKLHPHLYFGDYSHSIWLDGNIGIRGDARDLVAALERDTFIGGFAHPLRDCIYDEAVSCIELGKDEEAPVVRQMEGYRAQGFDEARGLWETGVLVRRHNDPACIRLMSRWWREIQTTSRRDQLSFPVVSQEQSVSIAVLGQAGSSVGDHPGFRLYSHAARSRSLRAPILLLPGRQPQAEAGNESALTIGICVHNALEHVTACLQSVVRARTNRDPIVIVDDASDEPTQHYLQDFAARHPGVRLIRSDANAGYTVSANLVLRSATTEWVTLLNSDTVVGGSALQKVRRAGRQYPRLAAVGPLSNAATWQSIPDLVGPDGRFAMNALPAGATPDDMDRLCETVAGGVVLFAPFVNGFCLTLRRSALDEVGVLDEESFPRGYGEEDDLCLRLADAGYVCGIAADAYVYHAKSASFSAPTRDLLVIEGRQSLNRKHSAERLAAASDTMRRNPALQSLRQAIGHALQRAPSSRS
jgi:O-antigen biosynthesis protein